MEAGMAKNSKTLSVRFSDHDLEFLAGLAEHVGRLANERGVRRTKNLASLGNVVRALIAIGSSASVSDIFEEAVDQARRDGPKSYRQD